MGKMSDISNGAVIKFRDGLFQVVEFQHVSPGKGSSFVRTKMKSLETGKVLEFNFKDGDTVDVVRVDRTNMQFLYGDSEKYTFMDMHSYEQVEVPKDAVGDEGRFLHEGLEVMVVLYEGRVLSVALPKKVTMTVAKAPDAVKGDSSGGNVTKDVELENGTSVRAPLFIKDGDQIVINAETGEYCERFNG